MAPVSFVGKKDGKRYIIQNYRYLNEWTVKNNYSLPLISDIVKNLNIKKVFTKLDKQWGHNNVWVKEDKWKVMCHKLYSACISTTSRLIFTN